MPEIDFMSAVHKSTARDYLARVNDAEFPKARAANLAKQWGYDYWDGDRRINYGGYKYIPGRWTPVAKKMVEYYGLKEGDRILDVGCGKGFQLVEFKSLIGGKSFFGVDISSYAVGNAHHEVIENITCCNAANLPFADNSFDFVFSINTLHNMYAQDLEKSLREIVRVGRDKMYICVESYRTEEEKVNLLYWQVTCEAFNTPEEWQWWFRLTGYHGDYSFIYFE